MKYVRYAFIAVLLYCLITSVYGYLAPSVTVNVGEVLNAKLNPSVYESILAGYRASVAQWLILISLILAGWIFSSKRWLVYLVSLSALLLLGHLLFVNVKKLGYTFDQSIFAIFQGHGSGLLAWSLFYFIAIVTLLASAQKKSAPSATGNAIPLNTLP